MIATTKDSYDIGVPAMDSRRALIYVSGAAYRTGTVNNVYASWVDLTGATGCTSPANEPGSNAASTCKSRIWFARSTDGGTTWSAPVMTNNQSSLNDQFNQWLGVDDTTGRMALIYYDTVGDSTRKKTERLLPDLGRQRRHLERRHQAHHRADRRDRLRRRLRQPVRRLQQPVDLRQQDLPLLDRPPQRRQGRDLDRARHRAVDPIALTGSEKAASL